MTHSVSSTFTTYRPSTKKSATLATALQRNIPRPLDFLQTFAGIGDGLDTNGDALLALFPAAGGNDDAMQFCIWLPVTDYGTFLNSIHATSIDGVAATTIGGEDLLVANHGNWALIMDPDQRDRITKLAAGATSPRPFDHGRIGSTQTMFRSSFWSPAYTRSSTECSTMNWTRRN